MNLAKVFRGGGFLPCFYYKNEWINCKYGKKNLKLVFISKVQFDWFVILAKSGRVTSGHIHIKYWHTKEFLGK